MDFQTIGRFNILAKLGQGGMGAVYHAYDPKLDREVALKLLLPRVINDPHYRTRFDREAKAIIKLEHKAIVPVYDVDELEIDGVRQPFLIMRYMPGGTLNCVYFAGGSE